MIKPFFAVLVVSVTFAACKSSDDNSGTSTTGKPGAGTTFTMSHNDGSGAVDYSYTVNTTSGGSSDTVWSSADVPGRSVRDSNFTYVLLSNGDVALRRPDFSGGKMWIVLPVSSKASTSRTDAIPSQQVTIKTIASSTGSGNETVSGASLAVQHITIDQATTNANNLTAHSYERFEFIPSVGLFYSDSVIPDGGVPGTNYTLTKYSEH